MSFINDIKATWWESLTFYKWSELKTLGLVTLNTFGRATGLLIKYFWWLFLGLGIGLGTYYWLDQQGKTLVSSSGASIILCSVMAMVNMIMYSILVFICFLAVRASTERKDKAYFWAYFPRFFGYAAVTLCGSRFSFIPESFRFFIIFFAIFFFLDAEYSIKNIFVSIFNGLKIIIYFLPFFMLFPIVLALASMIFGFPLIALGFLLIRGFSITYVVMLSGFMIFNLLFLSLVSALYIKIKHGHYRLFFKV